MPSSAISKQRLALATIERQRRQAAGTATAAGQMDLLSWTAVHRCWLRPGQPFDLMRHLYLVGLYNCRAQEMVIYKASQMGASEFAVSKALHLCDQRGGTALYVFPTEGHVSDFSSARIGPALEASPYLARIVASGAGPGDKAAGRRGADRVTLKRVRDRFLYLRGAQVSPSGLAAQLKSVDADQVTFDELDEMDPRARAIGAKRLGHSLIAEVLDVSTPTYAGRGIHARWLESDQREWHVRCAGCGERQPLDINQVVTEWDELGRPTAWHGKGEGKVYPACRKCGRELDRLGRGEWVATFPERKIAGFHLSKLFSATADLAAILSQLQRTDETIRKECFNQDLGLPYTPRGGQLTDAVLDACRRDYAHGPVKGERPFMGVDVGAVLHVVIRGPLDAAGERPQRFAGEVATFDELGRLIREYRPRRVVVDAMPETRMARALQADFPEGLVWLAYYTEESKDERPARFDARNGTVVLDRTRALDATLAGFSEAVQENTLPAAARAIGGGDYYKHLTALVRVVEERAGRAGTAVARYVAPGADHYCFAAGTLINSATGPIPIEQVRPGMRVMTRLGYRRVTAAGMTAASTAVRRYTFSNGTTLVATPSHPIYVHDKGFIPLDAVTYGDIIELCQHKLNQSPKWNPSSIKVSSFDAIPIACAERIGSISHRAGLTACGVLSDCIRRFGKTVMAPSRLATTFTTGITIRSITIWPTWSASPSASTGRIISSRQMTHLAQKLSPRNWIESVRFQRHGIKPQRESGITKSWLLTCGRRSKRHLSVPTATKPSRRFEHNETLRIVSAQMPVLRRIGERRGWIISRASAWCAAQHLRRTDITGRKRVHLHVPTSSVAFVKSEPAGDCPVYNLSVEEAHEYYANGILVHNCHAEGYCWAATQAAGATSLGVAIGRGAKGW